MITLIIVDPQYDFIEHGKLPVDGGTKALDNVAKLIDSGEVGGIVITQDSHKPNHCSFKDFGGEFPEHCVRGTHGYLIYEPIIKAIKNKNICTVNIYKGYNTEEFSGFTEEYADFYNHVYLEPVYDYDNTSSIVFRKDDKIVICGLAGDICVLNTIEAILPAIPNLEVFVEGTASLDNGEKLHNFMSNNNIKEYKFK